MGTLSGLAITLVKMLFLLFPYKENEIESRALSWCFFQVADIYDFENKQT